MKQRTRPLAVIVATAVAFAALGFGSAQFIRSPDEVARSTEPPAQSIITATVERRVLTNQLVVRGDIAPSSSVSIKADAASGINGEARVVTGRVPRQGTQLGNGSIAFEVSGRPLFVMNGRHPVYRALRPGSDGPDVKQLEQGLADLGFSPGVVDGLYDAATEQAVTSFYKDHGYDAMGPTAEEQAQFDSAHNAVEESKKSLRSAQDALESAEIKTKALKAAVNDAKEILHKAKVRLSELDSKIGIQIPRSEIYFVNSLPMTVVSVKAKVGDAPSGNLITLAGGGSQISLDIAPQYRAQVKVGGTAKIDDAATGLKAEGVITFVASAPGTAGAAPGLTRVRIRPKGKVRFAGSESNVRVVIPIKSTDSAVLTVPESALFTQADGSVHMLVLKNGKPVDIVVTTGLAADGLVEVVGDVAAGDKVVVGEK